MFGTLESQRANHVTRQSGKNLEHQGQYNKGNVIKHAETYEITKYIQHIKAATDSPLSAVCLDQTQ